jgi:hypothetical protein
MPPLMRKNPADRGIVSAVSLNEPLEKVYPVKNVARRERQSVWTVKITRAGPYIIKSPQLLFMPVAYVLLDAYFCAASTQMAVARAI